MQSVYITLTIIFILLIILVVVANLVSFVIYLKIKSTIPNYKRTKIGTQSHYVPRKRFGSPFRSMEMIFFSLLITLFTVYVFLNSYVLLTNRPLPFIETVAAFGAQTPLKDLIEGQYYDQTGSTYDALGRNRIFTTLKIPKLNVRLDLIPMIKQNDQFMYRINSGQYFFTSPKKDQKSDKLIIYLNKNWRTLLYPEQVTPGENIFLVKDDDSNALFKVKEVAKLPIMQDYVPAKTSNLSMIIVVSDKNSSINTFIHAEYVDINSITNK